MNVFVGTGKEKMEKFLQTGAIDEPASALQTAFAAAMDKGAARAREHHSATTAATQAADAATQPLPEIQASQVEAPAAEVAAWLRAGMASNAPRLPGNASSTNEPGLSQRLADEMAKSAKKSAKAWDEEAAAKARAELQAEFEAEETVKMNRQLKGE